MNDKFTYLYWQNLPEVVPKSPLVHMYKIPVVEWHPQTWDWRYLPKHDYFHRWPEPEILYISTLQGQHAYAYWKMHNEQTWNAQPERAAYPVSKVRWKYFKNEQTDRVSTKSSKIWMRTTLTWLRQMVCVTDAINMMMAIAKPCSSLGRSPGWNRAFWYREI